MIKMGGSTSDDFSVLVLASDLGLDSRSLLIKDSEVDSHDTWHDCLSDLLPEDFSDLDLLRFASIHGFDKRGNRILRIVGKFFPATIVSSERLKRYILFKLYTEVAEGPYCIIYMHSSVTREENSPGMTIFRWIYEQLPSSFKNRLQIVYFLHPGLRSRLLFATLGRLLLSGGLYKKIRYVSRLQYLREEVRKGEVEIPEFVKQHDDVLEYRPLTDYGIEPDPFHLNEVPFTPSPCARFQHTFSPLSYYAS